VFYLRHYHVIDNLHRKISKICQLFNRRNILFFRLRVFKKSALLIILI